MRLSFVEFMGTMPKINPNRLPDNIATEAENINSDSRCMAPYSEAGESISVVTGCMSMYAWDNAGSVVILSHNSKTTYCHGLTKGKDSILLSTPSGLMQIDPDNPSQLIQVGVPWPLGIPTATPTHTDDGNINTLTTVAYCYTVTDGLGQESKPSSASGFYDVTGTKGGLALSNITVQGPYIPLAGTADSCTISIYRCEAGTSDADFFFLESSTYSPSTGPFSYEDYSPNTKTLKAAQPDVIATEGWDSPHPDMIGIVKISGGFFAGYLPATNEICFSEPLIQYAWPKSYRLKMPQKVRQIIGLGDEIVVLTTSSVAVIRGTPGAMSVIEVPGGSGTPCTTWSGAVEAIYGVIFPGHDGLYLYAGSTCKNITAETLSATQWANLGPSDFIGCFYDDRYWAFKGSSGSAMCFNKGGDLTTVNLGELSVSAVSVDFRGWLWIVSGAAAYKWDSSLTEKKTGKWTSGNRQLQYPVTLSAGLITASHGTGDMIAKLKISVRLGTGDEIVITDGDVPLNRPFRIPGGRLYDVVKISISSKQTITGVHLATSMSELGG